jgi:hypothetical protein
MTLIIMIAMPSLSFCAYVHPEVKRGLNTGMVIMIPSFIKVAEFIP